MSTKSRVIVALDLKEPDEAFALARDLSDVGVAGFKVNSLLYGSVSVRTLIETLASYAEVFVDVKGDDMPQTVANTVENLASMGASIITLHASGGPEMLEAGVAAFEKYKHAGARGLFGVGILTSFKDPQCTLTFGADVMTKQIQFMSDVRAAGLKGMICSPLELSTLPALWPDGQFITPAIRPAGTELRGQARPGTPEQAMKSGATLMVVGSPIYAAADPCEALRAINEEAGSALSA